MFIRLQSASAWYASILLHLSMCCYIAISFMWRLNVFLFLCQRKESHELTLLDKMRSILDFTHSMLYQAFASRRKWVFYELLFHRTRTSLHGLTFNWHPKIRFRKVYTYVSILGTICPYFLLVWWKLNSRSFVHWFHSFRVNLKLLFFSF